jgi:DNA-binding NarL/FixJ family response regulator
MAATARTRVLVAEDFPLMREALLATLESDPGIDVVGSAADGVEALDRAREQRPDVLVLDLRMPRMTGVMVLRCLTSDLPGVRGLVVTGFDDGADLAGAVAAGAAGVLTKRATAEELLDAVAAVHRGERVICPSIASLLDPPESAWARFSPSELSVLRLVAAGETDGEISSALGVSPRTVQNRLTSIRAKTGVERRPELARWAGEHVGRPA